LASQFSDEGGILTDAPVNVVTVVEVIGQARIHFSQSDIKFSADLVRAHTHLFMPNDDVLYGDTTPGNAWLAAGYAGSDLNVLIRY
jgi:hypothetical protein